MTYPTSYQELIKAKMTLMVENNELTGYIYDRNNMTKDDILIIMRRAITAENVSPFVKEIGNGFFISYWYGNMTNCPAYEETDKEFVN